MEAEHAPALDTATALEPATALDTATALESATALEPATALGILGSPFAAEDLGFSEVPLVAIDLCGGQVAADDAGQLTSLVAETPAVVVGVCGHGTVGALRSVAASCDILVSDEHHPELPTVTGESGALGVLQTLTSRVKANPLASVTLIQLLRLGTTLDVTNALSAESLAYSTLLGGPEFAAWLARRTATDATAAAPEKADLVLAATDGPSMRISLNHPRRHNAFSARLRDQLVEHLRVAAANPDLRDVYLDGVGPSFCSGGDLAEFGTTPDPATAHRIRSVRSPAAWMHRIEARLHVHLHGHAIGAGLELAAFADHVSIDPDTKLALPEVAMGLIPGAGGTVSLPRRIGRQRTAWLALTGETISAAIAGEWGLADAAQRDYPPSGQ